MQLARSRPDHGVSRSQQSLVAGAPAQAPRGGEQLRRGSVGLSPIGRGCDQLGQAALHAQVAGLQPRAVRRRVPPAVSARAPTTAARRAFPPRFRAGRAPGAAAPDRCPSPAAPSTPGWAKLPREALWLEKWHASWHMPVPRHGQEGAARPTPQLRLQQSGASRCGHGCGDVCRRRGSSCPHAPGCGGKRGRAAAWPRCSGSRARACKGQSPDGTLGAEGQESRRARR
mmetsp:Transcript_54907/g.163460  ORF Transcript_54907/g.163460 Transcript_54907/m.163460 type:complete len:228 (+) Transcript_54907:692-1375(+)